MEYERILISLDLSIPTSAPGLTGTYKWHTISQSQFKKNSPTENKILISYLEEIRKEINNRIKHDDMEIPFDELEFTEIKNFLSEGNEIIILTKKEEAVGCVGLTVSGAPQLDYYLPKITINPLHIYADYWYIKKKYLFDRSALHLSHRFLEALKAHLKKKGYKKIVAYVDNYNPTAYKSLLRAGFIDDNWLAGHTNDIKDLDSFQLRDMP